LEYSFHSSLPISLKNELEKLFFFNEEQSVVYPKIEIALEKYGNPRIIEKNGKINIVLEKLEECQNLILTGTFGNSNLVLGIILHSRVTNTRAELIHFAVDKTIKDNANEVFNILLKEITRIYKMIKGIEDIYITYLGKKIKII